MRELYSQRLRTLANTCLTVGILATAVAIAFAWEALLRVSLTVLAAGVLAFVANFIRLARWGLLEIEFVPSPRQIEEFHRLFPRAKDPDR